MTYVQVTKKQGFYMIQTKTEEENNERIKSF